MRKPILHLNAWILFVFGGALFSGCGDSATQPEATSESELEQFLRDNPEYAAPDEVSSDPNTEVQTLGL